MVTTPFGAAVDRLLTALREGTHVDVVAGAPRSGEGAGIDVALVRAAPGPPARHTDRRAHPVELDFLVAVAGAGAEQVDLFHAAWVAIAASDDAEVLPEAVAAEWWTAFGATPRPALLARARVTLDEPLERAALARSLEVRHRRDFPRAVPPPFPAGQREDHA